MNTRDCVEAIRDRVAGAEVFVVAIDGMSAAGKSTFAEQLEGQLDAAVIHGDDFYRDMPERARRELSAVEGVDRYFDWERLREEALLPLRQGRAAAFRPFDWARGEGLADVVTIEPRRVVVIEGVYSARPELRDLVDLAVLVETSTDERQRRRRTRHDAHDWEYRWDAAERFYFASVRPRDEFDVVVTGSA